MDLRERLKRLIEDAMSVWGDSDARRPFTRRVVDEATLREEYKRSQKSGNDTADTADKSQPGNPEGRK